MLRIYSSSKELHIGKLMALYSEDLIHNTPSRNMLKAEQDFYGFIIDFLREKQNDYWIWEIDGCYVSALRTEPYRDGILLAGLVTESSLRKRGYAKSLISETLQYLGSQGCKKVYSHIHRDNFPSIQTHYACGFQLLHQHAALLDGSVNSQYYTFSYEL